MPRGVHDNHKNGCGTMGMDVMTFGEGNYQDKACYPVLYTYGVKKCTDCPREHCYLDTMADSEFDRMNLMSKRLKGNVSVGVPLQSCLL